MIAVLETFIKRDQVETVTLFPIPEFVNEQYAINNKRKWVPEHLVTMDRDRRIRVISDHDAKQELEFYRAKGFQLADRSYRGGYTWHTFRAQPQAKPDDTTFRQALQYPEEFKGTFGKKWFDQQLEQAQGQREGTVVGLLGGGTQEAGDHREDQARQLFALDPIEFSDFIVDHRLAIMDAIHWGRPFCYDAWARYNERRKMPDIPADYFRFRNLMYPAGAPPFTGEWIRVDETMPQAGMEVIVGAWYLNKWCTAKAIWVCRGLKPSFDGSTLLGPQIEWVPEIQQHCLLEGWYNGPAKPLTRYWTPTHWQVPAPPPPALPPRKDSLKLSQ